MTDFVETDVNQTIRQYETFLQDSLQPAMELAVATRARTVAARDETVSLIERLSLIRDQELTALDTRVLLGAGVYAQAHIPDTSAVFVDVGLGIHVEMDLGAALGWLSDTKLAALEADLAAADARIAQIVEDTRTTEAGIRELMNTPEVVEVGPHHGPKGG